MDGMTILISLLSSVGVSGLLVAGLVFLAKTWIGERIRRDIQHEYDTRLASHKAELSAQRDAQVERVRADLKVFAMERQVRFQGLYEQSAKAVAEIYSRLQRLQNAMDDYVSPVLYLTRIRADLGAEVKEETAVQDAFAELRRCWPERKIFVPPDLVEILDDLERIIVDKFAKCSSELMKLDVWKAHLAGHKQFVEGFGRSMFGDGLDQILESKQPPIDPSEFMKQFEDVDKKIEGLFKDLEKEFRKLLGFELAKAEEGNWSRDGNTLGGDPIP